MHGIYTLQTSSEMDPRTVCLSVSPNLIATEQLALAVWKTVCVTVRMSGCRGVYLSGVYDCGSVREREIHTEGKRAKEKNQGRRLQKLPL